MQRRPIVKLFWNFETYCDVCMCIIYLNTPITLVPSTKRLENEIENCKLITMSAFKPHQTPTVWISHTHSKFLCIKNHRIPLKTIIVSGQADVFGAKSKQTFLMAMVVYNRK